LSQHQRHFRIGASGDAVVEIRSLLTYLGLLHDDPGGTTAGGTPFTAAIYDTDMDRAVRAFQQQRGLTVDCVVGPLTYRVLDEARWRLGDRLLTHVPGNLMCGDDVLALQQRLLGLGFRLGRADG
jgi:N-acetylmuramoyl-L-alanine amidase